MRQIEVSTSVYAGIWARRISGEETEDAILRRLLGTEPDSSYASAPSPVPGRVRWRDDVRRALVDLGGAAPLAAIYDKVHKIRRAEGRNLPVNTDAIVRRELEQNCPTSKSYTRQRRWFLPAYKLGAGVWKLHDDD